MTIGVTDFQAICQDALRFRKLYQNIRHDCGPVSADVLVQTLDEQIEADKQQPQGQGDAPCVLI
jgi:hypothetical protein